MSKVYKSIKSEQIMKDLYDFHKQYTFCLCSNLCIVSYKYPFLFILENIFIMSPADFELREPVALSGSYYYFSCQ